MMKRVGYFVALLVLSAAPLLAQTTTVISDTAKVAWTPSLDNATTFGTPPVPVLSNYIARLYLKAAVSPCTPVGTCIPAEPTTTPVLTLDFGKPAVVGNTQMSPPIQPLIVPNVEYYLWLRANGPGGISPGMGIPVPFGFPAAPRGVVTPVTFTP